MAAPKNIKKKKRVSSVVEPISEINKIKIVDNGDPMVELNTYCPKIVIGANWRTGAKQVLYARQHVADMLNKAANYLPAGYKLDVFSAFRSIEEQIAIYNRVYRRYKRQHKGAPKSLLRRLANRFVHPPDIKTPPGHSTGGCIDLSLIGPDGQEVNMTKPFKWRTPKSRTVTATYAEGLHLDAQRHRKLLIDAMTKAGFTNYAGEWWHWSYGDSCWAWRVGKTTAIYGVARLSNAQLRKREQATRSATKKQIKKK